MRSAVPAIPKIKPYRNQKLRDLANGAPCCCCGKPNDGTVVGAHSNSLEHGKGMGTKSHDILCYCCSGCHRKIDIELTRDEAQLFFLRGVYNTFLWLLQEGHLVVGSPKPDRN